MPDVFTVFLNKDDDDSSSMSPNFTDVCMVGAGHKLANLPGILNSPHTGVRGNGLVEGHTYVNHVR